MFKTQNSKLFHFVLIGALLLFSAGVARAQKNSDDLPTATTWRDFRLNITKPDEVIKTLGKPKKDKTEFAENSLPNGWTTADKGKSVRSVFYKKIGTFDSIEFTFADDKLIAMNFLLKQNKFQGIAKSESSIFPAAKMPEVFKTDFLLFQGAPKNAKIADYEGQKETTIPKIYPQYYSLLGINNESVILISIENSSLKSSLKGIFNKPTVQLFPGFAQRIQIFSRS